MIEIDQEENNRGMVHAYILPFSDEEFRERQRRVKARMAESGLDLLIITDPCNMYYLTGYDAWSFYVCQAVLLSLDTDLPIWIGREMDAPTALVTTRLPRDAVRPYTDDYVDSSERHPMQFLGEVIVHKGWASSTIGVEMGAYYYTAHSHMALERALPNARLTDCTGLVNWVRLVKSDAEIALMRQAGEISEVMMAAAVSASEPGVRQCDVVAEAYRAQMRGTEEFGGVYSTTPVLYCAGARAGEPHPAWSDERLATDMPINIELSGCRRRYHAPLARTVYLGKPPPEYRDLADAVIDGLNAGLDVLRSGVTCEEVEAAWRAALARRGYEKKARIGYSIGIGYPPTWGERTASIRLGDRTVLEPNMAFHLMTGLWKGGTGVTITQSIVVSDDGWDPLTGTERSLIEKR